MARKVMHLREIPPLSYVLSDAALNLDRYNSKYVKVRSVVLPCGRHFCHDESLGSFLKFDAQDSSYVFIFGLAIDLISNSTFLDVIAANLLKSLKKGRPFFLK